MLSSGAAQADAALQHPQCRRLAQVAVRVDVVVGAIFCACAGVRDVDLQRAQGVADAVQLGLDVAGDGNVAVGHMKKSSFTAGWKHHSSGTSSMRQDGSPPGFRAWFMVEK
jgi:hypothetical protein